MAPHFAHIADVHLGAWKDPTMRQWGTQAFAHVFDKAIHDKVDFIIIAGDLFHTAIPGVDILKHAIQTLKKAVDHKIPIYFIAGSHDYSPSGKSMLDVIEHAGLATNVMRGNYDGQTLQLNPIVDPKTKTLITGIAGTAGMLDERYYRQLDHQHISELASKAPYSIFVFHTAISELLPSSLNAITGMPQSLLPKGFSYYAGGHVHIKSVQSHQEYTIAYPGPVFPAAFPELQQLGAKANMITVKETANLYEHTLCPHHNYTISVTQKTTGQILQQLDQIPHQITKDSIVTIQLKGKMSTSLNEIPLKRIVEECYDNGAALVLRSTAQIQTQQFTPIQIDWETSTSIEQQLINEQIEHIKIPNSDTTTSKNKILQLINTLGAQKEESENTTEFEERMCTEFCNIVDITKND